MYFQKSTDMKMDIHDFWMTVFNYMHTSVDIHIDIPSRDIHARTFCYVSIAECPCNNINE